MPGSFWKITALVGVLGLGCLIVLHAQKGMSDATSNSDDSYEDLDAAFDDLADDDDVLNPPESDDDGSPTPFAFNEPTPAQPGADDFGTGDDGFPWRPTTAAPAGNNELFATPPTIVSTPVGSTSPTVIVEEAEELIADDEFANDDNIIDADDLIVAADGVAVDDAAEGGELLLAANEVPSNPFATGSRTSSTQSAPPSQTQTQAGGNPFLVLPPRSDSETATTPDAPSPASPTLNFLPSEYDSPALLPTPSPSRDDAGQTEPSPAYLRDDVQYFPAGPDSSIPRTRTSTTQSQEASDSAGFTITAGATDDGSSAPAVTNPFGASSSTPAPSSQPTSSPPRTLSFPAAGGSATSNPFGPTTPSIPSSDPFAPTTPQATDPPSSSTGDTSAPPSVSPSSVPSGSSNPFGATSGQPATSESSAPARISIPGCASLDDPAPASDAPIDTEPTPATLPSSAPSNPFPQSTNPRPIDAGSQTEPTQAPARMTFPSVNPSTTPATDSTSPSPFPATSPPAATQTPSPFATQPGTTSPTTSFPARTAEIPATSPSSVPTSPTTPTTPANNTYVGDGTVDGVVSSNHQPELQIQKVAPPQAIVGEFLIYEIHVRNVGQSAAHHVVVEDRIPLGSELRGTSPVANLVGTQLVWTLNTLEPGQEQIIKVRVIPTAAGELGSVATVSFRAEVAATTVITAPELSVDMTGPAEMAMGEEGAYQFTIRNDGDGEARDVVIVAMLPDGLNHPGGRELEYAIGNIAPGEVRTADLVLTAASSGAVSPVAQVTIAGQVHDQAELDINLLESRIEVRRQGPIRRFVGRPATYTNVVTNLSAQPLTNVAVVEAIPQGLDLASIPEGGRFDPLTRTITWTIPQLEAHGSREFRSSVVAAQEGNWDGSLIASDSAGNRAQLQTQIDVAGFSSLIVDVEHAGQPVLVGEQVSLRLTIRNAGTAAARGVQASIEVPAEMEFVTAQGPVAHQVDGRTVTFEAIDGLAVSGEQSFDIVLTAVSRGDARVRMLLNSTDLENPIVQEQAVRVFDEN